MERDVALHRGRFPALMDFESGFTQEGWDWAKDPEGERRRIEFGNAYVDAMYSAVRAMRRRPSPIARLITDYLGE